jgi:hypothetical protein
MVRIDRLKLANLWGDILPFSHLAKKFLIFTFFDIFFFVALAMVRILLAVGLILLDAARRGQLGVGSRFGLLRTLALRDALMRKACCFLLGRQTAVREAIARSL